MAQLAIKGHQTRGKEVIEILEMLGGNNPDKLIANFDYLGYFIGKETRNIYHFHLQGFDSKNVIIFTLEEFLEKFPYKVGDKVSSKYLKNYEVSKMEWESVNNRVIYKLQGMGWYSADELQPYKEEAMDKVNKAIFDTNAQCCDIMNHLIKKETMEGKIESFEVLESHCANEVKIEFDPSKFEIVKRDNRYYVVKKQPQYPKTYIMTREEQIRKAGIEYTYRNRPMCIGGGAFSEMVDEMNRNKAFEEGAKWADEHPSEQVYTKKQLGEMGFPFTLNGDIVTPNELDEHYRRGIEYRKQKLIEKVCNRLEMRFDEYLVREVRKIMEE